MNMNDKEKVLTWSTLEIHYQDNVKAWRGNIYVEKPINIPWRETTFGVWRRSEKHAKCTSCQPVTPDPHLCQT